MLRPGAIHGCHAGAAESDPWSWIVLAALLLLGALSGLLWAKAYDDDEDGR